jgi:hypothetical protein
MQERLFALSVELAAQLGTAYTEMASIYVPVSSALLTDYDAAYLEIGSRRKEKD